MLRVKSKTRASPPGAERGPRPHCKARLMSRPPPNARTGGWEKTRGSAAKARAGAGVCEV